MIAVSLVAEVRGSTVTATVAGEVVMEGVVSRRLPEWQRRLITRALALIPAMATVVRLGDHATAHLLVLSQVFTVEATGA